MAMLRWEEESSEVPPLDKELLGVGELPSPRDHPSYWLSKAEWSSLKPYTHHHQQTQQAVFIHIHIYVRTI